MKNQFNIGDKVRHIKDREGTGKVILIDDNTGNIKVNWDDDMKSDLVAKRENIYWDAQNFKKIKLTKDKQLKGKTK